MAFTLQEVGRWLHLMDIKYHHDVEKEVIIFQISDDSNKGSVFIRAKEDGELFAMDFEPMMVENNFLDIKPNHPHINTLLMRMLYENYMCKFGTWEYDPNDGDIKMTVEIPLEDAKMTEKQFRRIFSIISTALDFVDVMKHIIKTGELPPEDDEVMAAQLFGEFLEFIKSKNSGKTKDDSDGI